MKYTNLKRIAQTVILLLCTLGIAVTSFCFAQKEAETPEKAAIEEIMTNKLIRELLEREQWKSAFCGRKALPVSEGQMQESCDALEILKVEREIELDDYAEAYYGFLKEYFKDCSSMMIPRGFRLAYIDGDEIPELLIMEDYIHPCGVKVYTYYNGRIIEVGEFGSIGTMRYAEKKGMIYSGFYNMGEGYSDYFKLEKGVLEQVCALYHLDGDAFLEPIESYYEIDDVPVSEAVYDAKWRELERDEYISIGYRDAVFVDDILELKSLLAQEIEGIEEKNYKDMK